MNLDDVLDVASIYKSMLDLNGACALGISDKEKFVFVDDKMGMGVKLGDPLKPGSATQTAILSGEPVIRTFEGAKSSYAVDYTSYSYPIVLNGEVLGCLSWTVPTNRFKLNRMAQEMSAVSEELTASVDEFTGHAEQLTSSNAHLYQLANQLLQQMRAIESINKLVSELASQSQLLGLNASIEAAHAGEFGLGFAVVAGEIRKLSEQSMKSAKTISQTLRETKEQVGNLLGHAKDVSRIGEQQSEGAEQLAQAIYQINAMALDLNDLSKA